MFSRISFVLTTRGRTAAASSLAAALLAALSPTGVRACACGCGIFEVGTSSMLPTTTGGMLTVTDAYQNQSQDWSGSSRAPAGDNADRRIATNFLTIGAQYLFTRSWGLEVSIPYVTRHFETVGGASGSDIVNLHWSQLGDVRIQGVYTGFSPDLSTGLTFGVKLPNGSFTHNDVYDDVDRDTQVGSGSTDLLLGAFHRGNLGSAPLWQWFAQGEIDQPVLIRDGYRPGVEVDASLGVHYDGWRIRGVQVTPIAQVLGSVRASDSGINAAAPVASGYQRVLLSPGLEVDLSSVRLYADVELPVYQHVTGDQLVAPVLWKFSASYHF